MNGKKPIIDYRSARIVMFALFTLGLLVGIAGQNELCLAVGTLIVFSGLAVQFLYYRCPHCGRHLGREGGLTYCPYCGRALDAPANEPLRTLTISACAKLNLTLDILGKRPDGYHEMQMVMQTVTLYDDVSVTLADGGGIRCQVEGADLPCDERNLAVKAAKIFCETTDYRGGIDIALQKRIPSEAGMAGGSADAAAVLRALRDLVSPALTDERLEQIGAHIGSDVPFCIRGGTQLAEGRGEILTALKAAPPLYAAICKPDFPISTPTLFARVDGVALTDRPDTKAMLAAIESGDADALCANVCNVFEQALEGKQRDCIEKLKLALLLHGAKAAAMTGSGSAVFGLFRDEDTCRKACDALQNDNIESFCAAFV